MATPSELLTASQAARRLGISTKALRIYELRGMIKPVRTAAGWRMYGPDEMQRAEMIVALRALDLSLGQIADVLNGAPECLDGALAQHQVELEGRMHDLTGMMANLSALRSDLAQGQLPSSTSLAALRSRSSRHSIAFDLPWPWNGERFEMNNISPITFIVGPLASGKTRLARRIAKKLPNGRFLGIERLEDDGAAARDMLQDDNALRDHVGTSMSWLAGEGATLTSALRALVIALEIERSSPLVIDMVEQDLDQDTQVAVMSFLRRRRHHSGALFLLTRSTSILDLNAPEPDEAILFCPANHSPPIQVLPYPGSPGFEALASCLASPDVRARTAGVVAVLRDVA